MQNLHAALDCFAAVDDAHDQALILGSLGVIEGAQGNDGKAVGYFDTALPSLREVGDWQAEVETLVARGKRCGGSGVPTQLANAAMTP